MHTHTRQQQGLGGRPSRCPPAKQTRSRATRRQHWQALAPPGSTATARATQLTNLILTVRVIRVSAALQGMILKQSASGGEGLGLGVDVDEGV